MTQEDADREPRRGPEEVAALLDALLHASSADDAALAAFEIINLVLPGRAALSSEAPELIRSILDRSDEVSESPYRAYVLQVLTKMESWSDSWRRITNSDTPDVKEMQAMEKRAAGLLRQADSVFRHLLSDPDPEVRSISYLLAGEWSSQARYLELRDLLSAEGHELAHACLVQAVLRSAPKTSHHGRKRVGRELRQVIAEGSALDRAGCAQNSTASITRSKFANGW